MNEYLMLIDQIHLEETINSLLDDRVVLTEGVNIKEKLKKIIDNLIQWVKNTFKMIIGKFFGLLKKNRNKDSNSGSKSKDTQEKENPNSSNNKQKEEDKTSDEDSITVPKNAHVYQNILDSKVVNIIQLIPKVDKYIMMKVKTMGIDHMSSFAFEFSKGKNNDQKSGFERDMDAIKNGKGSDYHKAIASATYKFTPTDMNSAFNNLLADDDCMIDKDHFNKDFNDLLNDFNPDNIYQNLTNNTEECVGKRIIQWSAITDKNHKGINKKIDIAKKDLDKSLKDRIKSIENHDKYIQQNLNNARNQVNKSDMENWDPETYKAYMDFFQTFTEYYKKVFESFKNMHIFYNRISSIIGSIEEIDSIIYSYVKEGMFE